MSAADARSWAFVPVRLWIIQVEVVERFFLQASEQIVEEMKRSFTRPVLNNARFFEKVIVHSSCKRGDMTSRPRLSCSRTTNNAARLREI
jgi:hypothetical protein